MSQVVSQTQTVPHVALVRWPEDASSVEELRAAGTPRLLLVASDATPPGSTDCDEDWIRLPAPEDDVRLRVACLAVRSAKYAPAEEALPEMQGDGRISFRGRWVALSQTEEAIAGVLLDRFGDVVDLDTLLVGCGAPSTTEGAIRVHLTRLRKRIRPLGLAVHSVHGRGYVLENESRRVRP